MPDTERMAVEEESMTDQQQDAWEVALTLPSIALGIPIFNVVDQPGDCGVTCPCEVGPSDGSAYGMHWTAPSEEDRAAIAADVLHDRTEDARDRYLEDPEEVDA